MLVEAERLVRRTAAVGALALAFVLAIPTAHGATPEEEAALGLFEAGRAKFDAGDHAEALALFEQAYQVVQNDFLRFYLGRSHAAVGQCEQAVAFLTPLRPTLPKGPRAQAAEDEARCRGVVADGLLADGACADAVTVLEEAPKKHRKGLKPRLTQATRCAGQLDTTTETGKAAAKAYVAARAALDAGRFEEARAAAGRSLEASPSNLAKVVAALAAAGVGACAEALPALAGLEAALGRKDPDAGAVRDAHTACGFQRARELVAAERCGEAAPLLQKMKGRAPSKADERWRKDKLRWCGPRATEFVTDTPGRKAAYQLFLAAREARDQGKTERAAELYQKALALADEAIIRQELAALTPPPEPEPELVAEPEPEPVPEPEPAPAPAPVAAEPDVVTASDDDGGGGTAVAGWVVTGAGVAMAGVAGYFVAAWVGDTDRANAARSLYETGDASQAVGALGAYDAAAADAQRDSALALSLGIAGAVAVTTGIVLLLMDGGDEDAAVAPVLGPTQVGVRGRF